MATYEEFIAPVEEVHQGFQILATPVESAGGEWSCNFLVIPPDPKHQRQTGQVQGPFATQKAAYHAGVAQARRVIDGSAGGGTVSE